jgi:hypothetical protein
VARVLDLLSGPAGDYRLLLLMVHTSGEPRVMVPFSPYFIDQVDAGQVKSILALVAYRGASGAVCRP